MMGESTKHLVFIMRRAQDPQALRAFLARALGCTLDRVRTDYEGDADVRLELIPLDRGFRAMARVALLHRAADVPVGEATLAARLATEFDTDVVVDADATPGLLPRGSGFMLIRPSGEAFLVNEDEVAVEPDDPPDDEDAFVIDERPGAMRPVARIPS